MKRVSLLCCLCFFLASCSHKPARVAVAPAPPIDEAEQSAPEGTPPAVAAQKQTNPPESSPSPEVEANADNQPVQVETGIASWYGPPYHNRRGSNGQVYNMNAMTAAHRTYPLGSIVRVTNVKTGSSAVVRITDRGPFIPGRVLDLSLAAAHKLDVYKPGVAEVKVELMESATSPSSPGKWAVQIGGFPHEPVATKLADHLKRRYHTANVLCFASPAGDWWIRVRVLDDNQERAQKLAAETQTPEGAVFLVRLD